MAKFVKIGRVAINLESIEVVNVDDKHVFTIGDGSGCYDFGNYPDEWELFLRFIDENTLRYE